jgi:hypothetical protein
VTQTDAVTCGARKHENQRTPFAEWSYAGEPTRSLGQSAPFSSGPAWKSGSAGTPIVRDVKTASALVDRFMRAFEAGDQYELRALLTQNVTHVSDGGGVVVAARKPVVGREHVLRLRLGLRAKGIVGLHVILAPDEVGRAMGWGRPAEKRRVFTAFRSEAPARSREVAAQR